MSISTTKNPLEKATKTVTENILCVQSAAVSLSKIAAPDVQQSTVCLVAEKESHNALISISTPLTCPAVENVATAVRDSPPTATDLLQIIVPGNITCSPKFSSKGDAAGSDISTIVVVHLETSPIIQHVTQLQEDATTTRNSTPPIDTIQGTTIVVSTPQSTLNSHATEFVRAPMVSRMPSAPSPVASCINNGDSTSTSLSAPAIMESKPFQPLMLTQVEMQINYSTFNQYQGDWESMHSSDNDEENKSFGTCSLFEMTLTWITKMSYTNHESVSD